MITSMLRWHWLVRKATTGATLPQKVAVSQPKKRKSDMEQSREFRCIYCNDLFIEPPHEGWMQCIKCKEWYNEQCGNDTDICDLCTDSQ